MNKVKLLSLLLIAALLITACSTKDSGKAAYSNGKGRYMEEDIALPEDISNDASVKLLQLKKEKGMPCLYAYTDTDGSCHPTRYLMKKGGSWTQDTPEWMSNVRLDPDCLWLANIFEDEKGNQYLYSLELEGEQVKGMLLRSADGKNYEKLTPEGWDVKNEYDYYDYPQAINVLPNGTLVALFFDGEIALYNKDTLKMENRIKGTHYTSTILSVRDQSLIVGQSAMDSLNLAGIDIYNVNNGQKLESHSFSTTISSYSYLDVNEKGDLLLCNADGIHILEQGSSLWQTIVDGTLNSLSRGNLYSTGFIACSDTNFYVLYNSNQGYHLKKYYFDETVDTVPSIELTVYALTDSPILRQAASEFQDSHPDVKVSFQIAMTDKEYMTATDAVKSDYIKALNTELLAGKGSDILVLDDLPLDSLIEKGILSDLSETIRPMLDRGELYDNIIQHFFRDDKLYCVPVRFELPLLLSREADNSSISSLESLAAYIREHPDKNLFGRSTYTDFISTYAPYLSTRIMNKDGGIDRESLIIVLTQLQDISAGYDLMDSYPEDAFRADGSWELASKVKFAIETCSGFLDAMFPFGIVNYVKGDFAPFDQSVTPNCIVGINSNSNQQDLCREFIALALSKEVGANDFYDGFSINKEALLLCAAADHSNYYAASEIENEDGTSSPITFEALTEEQTGRLIQACSKADKITGMDEQIISAINEVSVDVLTKRKSVEEAADRIIDITKIYLME